MVAILNDSTGTLVKGAYLDRDSVVGMIFGSGFNAAYMERVDRIPKLTEEDLEKLAGTISVTGAAGCVFGKESQAFISLDEWRNVRFCRAFPLKT